MRIEAALSIVRIRTVVLTFLIAYLLSFMSTLSTAWLDWVSFVLLFWVVYQHGRVTLIWAFVLGLLMDIQYNAVFGEHVLKYVLLVYFGGYIAKRLQYSSLFIHALSATGLLFVLQLLHALMYLLFFGLPTSLLSMTWIFLGIPVWLVLARLLSRSPSTVIGSWLLE